MALVEFRQNRHLVRQLTRIADCLEALCIHFTGVRPASVREKDEQDDSQPVTYTNQEVLDILEKMDKEGRSDEEISRKMEQIQEAMDKGKY